MVFVTSETMKCFGCGAEGHLDGDGARLAAEPRGSGPSLLVIEAAGSEWMV